MTEQASAPPAGTASNIPHDTMVRQARRPEQSGDASIRAAELRLANAYRQDPKEFATTLAALSLEELANTVTNA
jgi:hypothetical protein